MRSCRLAVTLMLTCTRSLVADEKPVALVHARILPVSGPEIADGTLVVHRGKIVAVGASGDVTVPPGSEIRDAKGRVIIPGLVDTHSHIGIYPPPSVPAHADGNEIGGPVQPGLGALAASWPTAP